jgi:hypothetical protein
VVSEGDIYVSLTSGADLFIGLAESAFQHIVPAVKSQRPSIFNYATPWFAAHQKEFCHPIPSPANGAPVFTPVSGFSLGGDKLPLIEYVLQIVDLKIEFSDGTFPLPTGMSPLPVGKFAIELDISLRFVVPIIAAALLPCPGDGASGALPVSGVTESHCVDLSAFAVGTMWFKQCHKGVDFAVLADAVSIPQLAPPGLREMLEASLLLWLNGQILPGLWAKIGRIPIDLTNSLPPSAPHKFIFIALTPTARNPNPYLHAHELDLYFNTQVQVS